MNENAIQRAVFDHIRSRGVPGLIAFHPMNGGVHQIGRRRGINAGLGVVSGVSDVIMLHAGKFYALELKRDGKKPTIVQIGFLLRVEAAGGAGAWAAGLDSALRQLEKWKLLRGKTA